MRSPITCIAILSIAPIIAGAQQYTIKGRITAKTGSPLHGTRISLRAAGDSTTKHMAYTDTTGKYLIATSTDLPAYITAEKEGYTTQTKSIDNAMLSDSINFEMKEIAILSEVTVTSRKPLVEYKSGRTIFNVEHSIAASAGDALDALKKTPGVQVINNEVTIAGKNSVAVMINGKLQQLTGDDLLQILRAMPASSLTKIEVITNPSAKYDAEGNSGIINLITRKPQGEGLKGSITASCNRNSLTAPSVSANVNYRRDRLNIFCNASTGIAAWKYTANVSTYFPQQRWQQQMENYNTGTSARINAGMEYNAGKRAVIGIQLTEAANRWDNDDLAITTIMNGTGTTDSVLYTTGTRRETYYPKHTVNVNYELKIDTTGKKLNVDADYYTNQADRYRLFDIESKTEAGKLIESSTNRMTSAPLISVSSVKADVEWPLKYVNLSMGGKASKVVNKADNLYEVQSVSGFETDDAKTNAFTYTEQIQALYVNAQKTIGKYELQLGLRGEHTFSRGYSSTLAQTIERDYTKLFPSGYIQYTPNDKHTISVNIASRINRPNYNSLNPFRFYYTPQSYMQGNTALQPSFNTAMELNYTWHSQLNFKVILNRATDYSDRIVITDTTNRTSGITTANIGNTRFAGLFVNGNANIAKWWEIYGSVNVAYSRFMPYNNSTTRAYEGANGWIDGGCTWYLNNKKTIAAELTGYYYTARQRDYKRWEEMSCINVAIRLTTPDKKWSASLTASDIFAKTYWMQTNLLNGTREYSYDDERSVRLSVTYKFGNKNVRGKRDKGATIEEIQRAN